MLRSFLILFLLIPILLNHLPLLADEPVIELELSGSSVYVGDEYRFQVKVDGVDRQAELILPKHEKLVFRQLGNPSMTSQTVIINGKMESFSGLVYNVGITPEQKGTYQVPALSVLWEGKNYKGESFKLKVVEPGQQNSMAVQLVLPKQEIYVGEELDINIHWYLMEGLNNYELRFPLLNQAKQLNLKVHQPETTVEMAPLSIQRFEIPFSKSMKLYKGESATLYAAKISITPTDAGDLVIPKLSAKGKVKRGTTIQSDVFGRSIRVPEYETVFAVSKQLKVKVKPLPLKGKAKDFSGGVGSFSIKVSPDAAVVKVGDPILLTIDISGEGNLSAINRPLLSDDPKFNKAFQVNESIEPGEVQDGFIRFTQTIRARSTEVKSIPSIQISYFNPDSERYENARSTAISIRVLKAERLKEKDIFVGTIDENPLEVKQEPIKIEVGLRELARGEALYNQSPGLLYWAMLLFFPPLIVGGLFVLRSKQEKKTPEKKKSSLKNIDKRWNQHLQGLKGIAHESGKAFYEQADYYLQLYLKERLGLQTVEWTTLEIMELVRSKKLTPEVADELVDLREQLHAKIYGGYADSQEARDTMILRMKQWRESWED